MFHVMFLLFCVLCLMNSGKLTISPTKKGAIQMNLAFFSWFVQGY